MTEQHIIPVILSGGTGTRLWPISRASHPKPFMKLPDGQTLLQKTFLRACSIKHAPEIITITNKEYYLKSKAEYEKSTQAAPRLSFLLEPYPRNTAPAIALAALKASAEYGDDVILLILPADHLVSDTQAFQHDCKTAFALANAHKLVTFGIKPAYPETGFGYIECGKPMLPYQDCFNVLRFVEKPNSALAQEYVNSQQYLWNSGMFCFKANVVLEQLKKYQPNLFKTAVHCWEKSCQHPRARIQEFDLESFAQLENISIDYALMEKSQDIALIACHFDWQDIGSWEAYKKLHPTDQQHNTVLGDAILIDSHDNFIHSEGRVIASIGINHLYVIDTPDALLITDEKRAQDVKTVVQMLKEKAHESFHTHRTVHRPWGTYTILEEGPAFKIKRIVVNPKASLSLQSHHHRSEHWIVLQGVAKVINGDTESLLNPNQSTFVPMGVAHRLSNPGDTDLVIIEVQTGSYLGEDDIIRFEDNYERIP